MSACSTTRAESLHATRNRAVSCILEGHSSLSRISPPSGRMPVHNSLSSSWASKLSVWDRMISFLNFTRQNGGLQFLGSSMTRSIVASGIAEFSQFRCAMTRRCGEKPKTHGLRVCFSSSIKSFHVNCCSSRCSDMN